MKISELFTLNESASYDDMDHRNGSDDARDDFESGKRPKYVPNKNYKERSKAPVYFRLYGPTDKPKYDPIFKRDTSFYEAKGYVSIWRELVRQNKQEEPQPDLFEDENLEEGKVKKVWKKSGGKIVKKFRCVGGPKDGQLVSNRASCNKRPDPVKSMRARANMKKNGKKIARKAAITKRTDPQSKMAQMLNKQKTARKALAKASRQPKITNNSVMTKVSSKSDGMNIIDKSAEINKRSKLNKYIKTLEK